MSEAKAQFAVLGLGTMGRNLALNVEEKGFRTAVWNRSRERVEQFLAGNPGKALMGARSLEELVASLERPRRLMLMVPAGAAVDSMIERLLPLLEEGDVLVDGGNADYRETRRREAEIRASGIWFYGTGVSGGEKGARHGPSIMPGGERRAYQLLRPVFEAIAARTESGPCVAHIGPDGSGHFVKMVHNGIEYGNMQLLAEAYDLMKRGLGLEAGAMADLFEAWNGEDLESYLVEITAAILRVMDEDTGNPLVEMILDKAGQKGTGRWTVEIAVGMGVPVPTIAAAVDARVLSSLKDQRVEAEKRIEGPGGKLPAGLRDHFPQDLRRALYLATVASYAQGFDLIRTASDEYGWSVELREVARIWKGGCIIRARLLDPARAAFAQRPALRNLMLAEPFRGAFQDHQEALRRVIAAGSMAGTPLPALSASLAWFDAWRTGRLPQNLIQAQRDAFGAHTYERTDRPGAGRLHTDWLD